VVGKKALTGTTGAKYEFIPVCANAHFHRLIADEQVCR
jgi:hypothetical protein